MSTSKQHPCVRGPLRECRSIRSGASGLLCISAVIGLLAVWRQPKTKKRQLFLVAVSQKLFSSPQRAHVTLFVKRDKLELAFCLLCSVHAVIQVPPDGVVGSLNCVVAIPSQPALLMWPCVSSTRLSVLSPRASRAILHSRHLLIASCLSWSENWLLAYCLPLPSPIVSFAAMGFLCHSDTCPA